MYYCGGVVCVNIIHAKENLITLLKIMLLPNTHFKKYTTIVNLRICSII